ncbi:Protein of unknown function [Bacillus wiedmannii]|nr:Protein of unknown function [Bacillus wiedmannii]
MSEYSFGIQMKY